MALNRLKTWFLECIEARRPGKWVLTQKQRAGMQILGQTLIYSVYRCTRGLTTQGTHCSAACCAFRDANSPLLIVGKWQIDVPALDVNSGMTLAIK